MRDLILKRLFGASLFAFLGPLLIVSPSPAQARVLLLTCQTGPTKYELRYDTLRDVVTTTHPRFKRPLRIERVKEDEDGLLLWVSMTEGPSQANFLPHWGKTRWIRHFQGYDQQTTDDCL